MEGCSNVCLEYFLPQSELQLSFAEVLHPSDHLCDPLLDVLQKIHTLLTSVARGMDATFQVRNHLSPPAGHTAFDAAFLSLAFWAMSTHCWVIQSFFSLVCFVCYANWWMISLSSHFLRFTKLSVLFSPPVLCGGAVREQLSVCLAATQGQSTTQMVRTGGGC